VSNRFPFDVLADGSLVLAVGDGCIQTMAKRAHRELTAALLDDGVAIATAGALLDLLEEFLNSTDFRALRAGHPELAGGVPCRVRLERRAGGGVAWALVEPR
jgi:hypothetical protein